jgi:hypothetical protein
MQAMGLSEPPHRVAGMSVALEMLPELEAGRRAGVLLAARTGASDDLLR